jgi:hypothetical protein
MSDQQLAVRAVRDAQRILEEGSKTCDEKAAELTRRLRNISWPSHPNFAPQTKKEG